MTAVNGLRDAAVTLMPFTRTAFWSPCAHKRPQRRAQLQCQAQENPTMAS